MPEKATTKPRPQRKRRNGPITASDLKGLEAGESVRDPAPRGAGVFTAVAKASGAVLFYFRYTDSAGKRDPLPIGGWDGKKGKGGTWSLAAARERAGQLARRYRSGERDLRAALEAEEAQARREREAAAQAEAAARERQQASLGALCGAYVAQLRRDGKTSARAVELSFTRNIADPLPGLWATPADEVTEDDLIAPIAALVDKDARREADKLRSYLRAAYAAGVRARQDAGAPAELRSLRIRTNPARDLATVKGSAKTRHRVLSLAELRAYWKRLSNLPGAGGALLRFHLLTGGQRAEQLARLESSEWDKDTKAVTLFDPKGRRATPRPHVVPLIPDAETALDDMAGGTLGPHLFTLTGGKTGASYASLRARIREVAEAMVEAGEAVGGPFGPGDIRRTVETRLAAAGVPLEVRAQLQSHGLGGVQARHYDRHDYLTEKREALLTLRRLLVADTANVVPLRRGAESA